MLRLCPMCNDVPVLGKNFVKNLPIIELVFLFQMRKILPRVECFDIINE